MEPEINKQLGRLEFGLKIFTNFVKQKKLVQNLQLVFTNFIQQHFRNLTLLTT